MKRLSIALIMAILFSTIFSSCVKTVAIGSGSKESEERAVAQFTSVKAEGSMQVFIQQGSSFKVVVTDHGNLLKHVETSVDNGELLVGYKKHTSVQHGDLHVSIIMPSLTGVVLNGSGEVNATGVFSSSNNMDARISGSGKINIQSGTAATFTAVVEGSGDINATGFAAVNANANISGSGDIRLNASQSLDVRISGSGKVYYTGNPTVSTHISGSGDVRKM